MSDASCAVSAQVSCAPPPAAGNTAVSEVSTVLVRVLAETAQQRGISPQTLLGESAAALYAEPAERAVSLAWVQGMFARASALTGDPALGLQCGLHASSASFGLMSPLVSHAHNLRHGIELVAQFHPLIVEGCTMQLVERLGVAQLHCELDALGDKSDRSFTELMMAGLARMLQSFGCERAEIHAFCFEYPRPAHYHAYSAAFAGKERFSQPFTGVEFAAAALDRPHLNRHSELHDIVRAQAEHNLKRCARPLTLKERVGALMNSRPAAKLPDMIQAARELGISVRSLRRRLSEEGTTYRELTQSRLYSSACALLRNPKVTLQSISFELGFSDATAFHRAFRRWAQITPAEYRSAFLHDKHAAAEH
jgi:AraC-like DNA-binding protein